MGIYRSDFSSVTVTGDGSGGSGGNGEVKVAITARSNIDKNDMVQLLPSADAVKIVRSDCAGMRPGNNLMQNASGGALRTLITADKRIIGAYNAMGSDTVSKYYEYGADGGTLNAYSVDMSIWDKSVPLNGNGFVVDASSVYYFFAQVGASPVKVQTQINSAVIVPSAGNSFWLVGNGTVEYWSSSATLVFRENINQTVFYDCATLDDGSLVTGAFIVKQDKSITNYTSLSIGGVYYSGNADHFWAVSQDKGTIYTFSTAGALVNTFSGNPALSGDIVPYNNDLIYISDAAEGSANPYTYYLPADKTKSITQLSGTQGYTNIAADPALNILYVGGPEDDTNPNLIAFDLTKLTPYSLSNSGVLGSITPISDGALLCDAEDKSYISKAIYTQFLGVSLGSVTAAASGYVNAANGTYTVNGYYGPQTYNIPPPVNNGPVSSGAGAKLLGTSCTVYSSTYTDTSS
ncbi:hypothetical protein [Acetobacter oryzoeni]|uniref:Uncharacterized protein n=1 Tax=Acetobacter oryzoeni TaxID=2500548 RepID=A0A5B9GIU6_9PROT|nr:hypothetical protein [Acetobacter oryzoeni]MCP1202232.1 hypothetical protein [Acetobacter oryzoeni]QEE85963.1 hypothetical protein EOV40_009755 [Acetobacter oryzoeni]